MSKATYIVWTIDDSEFVEWKYTGSDTFEAVFEPVKRMRRARWSAGGSAKIRAAAQRYIDENMQENPDAHVEVVNDD